MNRTFFFFILLQALDAATTLAALSLGAVENNPLVGQFMTMGPVQGLMLTKTIVIMIAAGGAYLGKTNGIRLANMAFSGVVVWNMTIIGRLAMA
jgi:hypothetical protein